MAQQRMVANSQF
jgi:hypothetical protein